MEKRIFDLRKEATQIQIEYEKEKLKNEANRVALPIDDDGVRAERT